MTVCIAAICDQGRSIVLVADKLVSFGYVQGESATKITAIHPLWYMMMAGDDIAPLFELADLCRAELTVNQRISLESVMDVTQRNYELIRMRRAEALFLRPIGWTIKRFTEEGGVLPDFREIQSKLEIFDLSVEILVAGFDDQMLNPARIFTMSSAERGIPRRHDTPSFAAIGSGGTAAVYMMLFKDFSSALPTRAAVYYALEAKYFGELATGVGESTDMLVLSFDGTLVRQIPINDEKTIEKKLIPICVGLRPRHLYPEDIDMLNKLPELKGFPPLPRQNKETIEQEKEDQKWYKDKKRV